MTSVMRSRRPGGGFTLVEVMISLAIVAVLLGLLLPVLVYARGAARAAVCAANLRHMGIGWQLYLQDRQEFPRYGQAPDWSYAGVKFVGPDHQAVVDDARPVNRYIAEEDSADSSRMPTLFRCPADAGIYDRGDRDRSADPGETCYERFGNSYRANPYLFNSTAAGIDDLRRTLTVDDITVSHSRLLLSADPVWWFATRPDGDPDALKDASWHDKPGGGNMLAVDGSVRFAEFHTGPDESWTLFPRGDAKSPTR